MKHSRFVVLSILSLMILGCSNKSLYEAIQENRVNDCRNLSYQKEQQCLNSLNQKSYEEYQRERNGDHTTDNSNLDQSSSNKPFSHNSIYNS